MADFTIAVEKIFAHEGGYVNNPNDLGGETNFGISKRSYPNIDIKNLTKEEAKKIYRQDFWNKILGDVISSQEVAEELFDFAVNAGVKRAIKILQKKLYIIQDGIFGQKTLDALEKYLKNDMFIYYFKVARMEHYYHICKKRKANREFLYGWLKRTLGK